MNQSEIQEQDFGYKCGEIYMNNYKYTYKCVFCSYHHVNISTLKKHLSQKHKNNLINHYSSNESIFHEGLENIPLESYYSDIELNASPENKLKIDIIDGIHDDDESEMDDNIKIFNINRNEIKSETSVQQKEELNSKSNSEWINCLFCRTRMYKYSLQNHINKFHSSEIIDKFNDHNHIINEFLCRFCNKCFTTIENINEHEKLCSLLDWIRCNDCENYILKNQLELHIEEIHNGQTIPNKSSLVDDLCCKICIKKISNRTIIQQDEKLCLSNNEKITCNYCDFCISKYNLRNHLINIHPENVNNLDSEMNYEKNDFDNELIIDDQIYEMTEEHNSTNKVKDLKIEILFDDEENLESYISPPNPVNDDWKFDPSNTISLQVRKINKYKNCGTIKSRNRRKLCTKCNRVTNDIYRHRKICSVNRVWVTCIYCGSHMFKERLENHMDEKHKQNLENDKIMKSITYESDNDDNISKENLNNNKKKPCEYCGRFVINLLQHELICSQSKTRVTCKICGKHIFQRNISKHMDLHNNLLQKKINKHNDKCRYCNRNFNTRWGSLERHERYCSNLMNREKCKYCKYSISKINMPKHLLNKHMDKDGNLKNILITNYETYAENDYKKLPCRYCNELYLQPVLHEKHCSARTGNEKQWTRCQICSTLVQSLRLSIHMKKIHKIITDDKGNDIENEVNSNDNIKAEFVKCILCGSHILLKNFQYHIFRIHKDRLPITDNEMLDYNKLSTIDLTEFRTTTIFPEWIKCKKCGLMVAEPTLESHLQIHKKFGNLRGTKFKCNICNKKYPARRYEQHIRTSHLDENNSVFCNECDFKRIHNDYYDDHMKWHRGEILGYQCKMCNRRYELKYNLDRHMKIHEEKQSCDCPECGKTFPNKLRLNQHIQIHSTDAKYQCDTCGKAFIIKSRLQSHQLTHMDKKFYRFPCTLCNKRFSGKAKLADHMITHTRTKNFKCDVCDAKFARKFDAIKHQRRHTEIGHLMCSICEKRFFLKRPLKDHLKSQHGILDEKSIIDTRVQQGYKDDTTFYVNEMESEELPKIISEVGDYEIVMEFDV